MPLLAVHLGPRVGREARNDYGAQLRHHRDVVGEQSLQPPQVRAPPEAESLVLSCVKVDSNYFAPFFVIFLTFRAIRTINRVEQKSIRLSTGQASRGRVRATAFMAGSRPLGRGPSRGAP